MKRIAIPASLIAYHLSIITASAAVPLRWTVETSRVQPATFEAYQGETLSFEAALQSYGKPLAAPSEYAIYWQTNGMGNAWWSRPCVTTAPSPSAATNVLFATWSPDMDVGAKVYSCFVGLSNSIYRAAFQIRLRPSPGALPNALPLPTPVIDFAKVAVVNPQWYTKGESDAKFDSIVGDSTNAAIRAVSRAFRPLHDEHVYVPGAMGKFSYESDTPGLADAIGDRQPTEYSYGDDYAEYDIYFAYNGYDVNAYGYGRTTDDVVNFDGYGYMYDPETGDYDQIYVNFVGRREAVEWVMTSDTFARESELGAIRTDINRIESEVGGETKVMRQDGEFEYGSGWGYVRHIMDSDRRMWRIRVPKWAEVSGMTTNAMDASMYYFTRSNPSTQYCTTLSPYPNGVMQNIMSWFDGWGLDRKLVKTRGIYGNDGTQFADYRIGVFYRDAVGKKKCAVEYDVTQLAYSPMSFRIRPVTDGLPTVSSYKTRGGNMLFGFAVRYLDLPDFERTWTQTYSSQYSFEITLTAHVIGLMVAKDEETSTTNGTIPLNYWLLCDCTWHVVRHNASTGATDTFDKSSSEVVIPWTVTVTCNSSTTMEDLVVPYYRVLSTRDPNLYYDKSQDVSYRIGVTNGCFYSEKVMDGDWRTAE